ETSHSSLVCEFAACGGAVQRGAVSKTAEGGHGYSECSGNAYAVGESDTYVCAVGHAGALPAHRGTRAAYVPHCRDAHQPEDERVAQRGLQFEAHFVEAAGGHADRRGVAAESEVEPGPLESRWHALRIYQYGLHGH